MSAILVYTTRWKVTRTPMENFRGKCFRLEMFTRIIITKNTWSKNRVLLIYPTTYISVNQQLTSSKTGFPCFGNLFSQISVYFSRGKADPEIIHHAPLFISTTPKTKLSWCNARPSRHLHNADLGLIPTDTFLRICPHGLEGQYAVVSATENKTGCMEHGALFTYEPVKKHQTYVETLGTIWVDKLAPMTIFI